MKINTVSNLALAAAFAGLLGGTAVRLNAQPLAGHTGISSLSPAIAGVMAEDGSKTLPKHACKGTRTGVGGLCASMSLLLFQSRHR